MPGLFEMIRSHACKCLLGALLLPAFVFAQVPSAASSALWTLTSRLEGAPGSQPAAQGQVCLSTEQMRLEPEAVVIREAERLEPTHKGPQNCRLTSLKRDTSTSEWTVVCKGPMGDMQGQGQGSLQENQASLRQVFLVATPMGRMRLTQIIDAKRTGACP